MRMSDYCCYCDRHFESGDCTLFLEDYRSSCIGCIQGHKYGDEKQMCTGASIYFRKPEDKNLPTKAIQRRSQASALIIQALGVRPNIN